MTELIVQILNLEIFISTFIDLIVNAIDLEIYKVTDQIFADLTEIGFGDLVASDKLVHDGLDTHVGRAE